MKCCNLSCLLACYPKRFYEQEKKKSKITATNAPQFYFVSDPNVYSEFANMQ